MSLENKDFKANKANKDIKEMMVFRVKRDAQATLDVLDSLADVDVLDTKVGWDHKANQKSDPKALMDNKATFRDHREKKVVKDHRENLVHKVIKDCVVMLETVDALDQGARVVFEALKLLVHRELKE